MRREFIIVLAVLVPFAALVAAGFAYSQRPVPVGAIAVNAPLSVVPTVPAPVPVAPLRAPALEAGVVVVDGRPKDYPPELAAPLKAVERQVATCFDDEQLRAPKGVELTVAFTPTREGAFAQVTVTSSWQDPYLQACVEDVFAETHWVPEGRETFAAATHTFQLRKPH